MTSFSKEQVEAIKEKCLFLVGGTDPFLTMGGGKLLEEYGMNAVWIKEAGHGINHECPEQVNQIIKDYLIEN